MRWLAYLLVVYVISCRAEEDPDTKSITDEQKTPVVRPIGVVYLIDTLGDGSGSNNVPENRAEGGILLTKPIADNDALPDGVYFRPEGGRPVDKSQVSKMSLLYKKNLKIYTSIILKLKFSNYVVLYFTNFMKKYICNPILQIHNQISYTNHVRN